jgi:hypothetical protein
MLFRCLGRVCGQWTGEKRTEPPRSDRPFRRVDLELDLETAASGSRGAYMDIHNEYLGIRSSGFHSRSSMQSCRLSVAHGVPGELRSEAAVVLRRAGELGSRLMLGVGRAHATAP